MDPKKKNQEYSSYLGNKNLNLIMKGIIIKELLEEYQ